MPDGKLTGSVDPEVAIAWFNHCFMKLLRDWRRRIVLDFEREHRSFDQLSLKELKQLSDRLKGIIDGIENGSKEQRSE